MSNYLEQRRLQKLGIKPTDQQLRAEKKKTPIAKKSAKKKLQENEAKKSKELSLGKFFEMMIECAPQRCMETGEPLVFKITQSEVFCHILPQKPSAVPSMAKNPLNIVYLNIDIHKKMDADLGIKSKGEYVKSMKIFPLLKERVKMMWDSIPINQRKSVPKFLQP